MITHIFKIIWNERKANAWIVLEFFVVFCILWFCTDYLFFSSKLFLESQGYDVTHVYQLHMDNDENAEPADKETIYATTMTVMERIRQYPGVESVSISRGAIPYAGWNFNSSYQINEDTTYYNIVNMFVDPDFFDVFKINISKGKAFDFDPSGATKQIVISPDRHGMFGSYPDAKYNVNDVKSIIVKDDNYMVVGTAGKIKSYLTQPFKSSVFFPIQKDHISLDNDTEITFRVNPANDTQDFAEKFGADMEQLLSISPYTFTSVTPVKKSIDSATERFSKENLKSIIAITIFLIANIFLGIIGTFWSRIQSRRSEIGLRIALGASKMQVKMMMFWETALMLFIASIPAAYVSLNLGQTDFLKAFGIPVADRVIVGTGVEQDFINYLVTFIVLIVIAGIAVWYPARLSTKMSPADALREE